MKRVGALPELLCRKRTEYRLASRSDIASEPVDLNRDDIIGADRVLVIHFHADLPPSRKCARAGVNNVGIWNSAAAIRAQDGRTVMRGRTFWIRRSKPICGGCPGPAVKDASAGQVE